MWQSHIGSISLLPDKLLKCWLKIWNNSSTSFIYITAHEAQIIIVVDIALHKLYAHEAQAIIVVILALPSLYVHEALAIIVVFIALPSVLMKRLV